MKKDSLAGIYTDSFRVNWNNLAFSDYGGSDYKYSDVAKIINLDYS